MDEFKSLIIDYYDYNDIIIFLNELVCKKIQFWFMDKQGRIRLRTPLVYFETVRFQAKSYGLEYMETTYEPEEYLFVGHESVKITTNILCDIASIASRVRFLSYKNDTKSTIVECYYLFLFNKMLQYGHFDEFETWDIWNKVCEHRGIDLKKNGKIIVSKIYDVYYAITSPEFDVATLDADIEYHLHDIQTQCDSLFKLAHSDIMSRGVRGVYSSIIIFSYNIMGFSAQKQCGFANIMRILTNPDFRRNIGL